MVNQIEFGPITPDHFVEIATLHTLLLPHDLFSLLGEWKLTNSVYPYLMNFVAVTRILVVNGKVIGFAFLLHRSFLDFGFFFKHSIDLTILIFKHPKIFLGSTRAILRRPSDLPTNELLWVCVHPEYQEQGLGKAMVRDLLQEFSVSNLRPVFVRTLEATPANVLFYKSLGFKVFHQSLGRVWLILN